MLASSFYLLVTVDIFHLFYYFHIMDLVSSEKDGEEEEGGAEEGGGGEWGGAGGRKGVREEQGKRLPSA